MVREKLSDDWKLRAATSTSECIGLYSYALTR